MISAKIGTKRYTASFHEKLEFDTWVFRSKRKNWGYMVLHIPGITWVKKSKSHGDWGYAKNVPDWCRRRFILRDGLPYHASHRGAVAEVIADIRQDIKNYGADYCEDYEGTEDPEPPLSIKLQRALTAQKRLRSACK